MIYALRVDIFNSNQKRFTSSDISNTAAHQATT